MMKQTQIHPTAIVDEGAVIGTDCKIWHWVHICKNAIIGNHCTLGQNVFVSGKAVIGRNVKIQNNVSIFDLVTLEDDVFCGPSVVFTNVLNPRSTISRRNEYKKTLVKQGATLGANSTIICGAIIGRYAFVAAGAVVTKNIPDYALYAGVPAKQIGWISEYGENLTFTRTNSGEMRAICPGNKDTYLLTESNDTCSVKKC